MAHNMAVIQHGLQLLVESTRIMPVQMRRREVGRNVAFQNHGVQGLFSLAGRAVLPVGG